MEEPFRLARSFALNDHLFKARTILIHGEVTPTLAADVTGKLIALASASEDDITVIINSQGGHVESGDTIHDMIRFVQPRVRMIGTGWVASAGALIYIAVPRADRFCLPNTRFLLHQPAVGQLRGVEADIAIEAAQIVQARERLNQLFADATGQPVEKIAADTNRNFWLTAEAAREYGLVGQIVQHTGEVV